MASEGDSAHDSRVATTAGRGGALARCWTGGCSALRLARPRERPEGRRGRGLVAAGSHDELEVLQWNGAAVHDDTVEVRDVVVRVAVPGDVVADVRAVRVLVTGARRRLLERVVGAVDVRVAHEGQHR